MSELELEILKNMYVLVIQGWIIIVLIAGCLIALFMNK